MCVSCRLGKSYHLSFNLVEHCSSFPLDIIHSYVWKSPILSNLGFKYYVIFVDGFSQFTWLYLMKNKAEVFPQFCAIQKLVENLFNTKIKLFPSDGAGEFDNKAIISHFISSGISFRRSCQETPQQNGVA